MELPAPHLFAFDEADHLIRIHLKLALEDVGFAVEEEATTLGIVANAAGPRAVDAGGRDQLFARRREEG